MGISGTGIAAPFLPTKEYGYRGGELLVTMASGDDVRLARFVTNLYYSALQRDPTSTELQDKVNQLAAAGATSQSQLPSDNVYSVSPLFSDPWPLTKAIRLANAFRIFPEFAKIKLQEKGR